jgi:hypothetical protein
MNLLAIILSVASFATSAVFCWLGVTYLSLAAGEELIILLGAFVLAYGITSIFLLGMAWWRPKPKLRLISQWAAAAVLALWVAGSMDSWRISGHEAWSILGIALLLFFNVAGVRRVLAVKGAAQQGAPGDVGANAPPRLS